MKNGKIYRIACVGVLSAMVFATNFLSVPIGDVARLHFGNVMCIVSGFLLGGVSGGFCAGFGVFFYSRHNPLSASDAFCGFATQLFWGGVWGVVTSMEG